MADSKCPSCRFEYFEVVKNKPKNSETELFFVQCSSCGTVVGLTNTTDSSEIEDRFLKLEEMITTLDHNIRIVAGKLGVK